MIRSAFRIIAITAIALLTAQVSSARTLRTNRSVEINTFQLHFELGKASKCLKISGQQDPSYILEDIPANETHIYQDSIDPMPALSYRFCRDSKNPEALKKLIHALHDKKILKFTSNVILTNLAYKISSGLKAQGLSQNGVYFYMDTYETHLHDDEIIQRRRIVTNRRRFYSEEVKQDYWVKMQLFWDLMEIFEEQGEDLNEYNLVPDYLD